VSNGSANAGSISSWNQWSNLHNLIAPTVMIQWYKRSFPTDVQSYKVGREILHLYTLFVPAAMVSTAFVHSIICGLLSHSLHPAESSGGACNGSPWCFIVHCVNFHQRWSFSGMNWMPSSRARMPTKLHRHHEERHNLPDHQHLLHLEAAHVPAYPVQFSPGFSTQWLQMTPEVNALRWSCGRHEKRCRGR